MYLLIAMLDISRMPHCLHSGALEKNAPLIKMDTSRCKVHFVISLRDLRELYMSNSTLQIYMKIFTPLMSGLKFLRLVQMGHKLNDDLPCDDLLDKYCYSINVRVN